MILDQFADWEGAFITNALKGDEISEAGANEVIWASLDQEPKQSIGGMTVLPDISLSELPEDLDALLLIGGRSWRTKEALQAVPVVETFRDAGKVIGFICDATYFAAEHGFLNDVNHTGNSADDLGKAPAYSNEEGFLWEEAVTDGNIVTANGNAPVAFAVHVLKALKVADEEDITMWSDFYTLGYVNALRKYGYLES